MAHSAPHPSSPLPSSPHRSSPLRSSSHPASRLLSLSALLLSALLSASAAAPEARPPNIVVLLADDLGYGDLGVAGHPTIRTPNIDALAREGTLFTQWLSANAVCTPSRAALLTGRLPVRTGMAGDYLQTLYSPAQPSGLDPDEVTIADLLKVRSYASAAVGKWHLGINARTAQDGVRTRA